MGLRPYDAGMAIQGSRIYHCNSNCSDLERSVQFYEAIGLRKVLRTVPSKNQSGSAFGLDEVAWDAWIMHSDDGLDGLSLDLLEWRTPRPTGTPPGLDGEPGYNRLMISTPDLSATVERCVAAGGTVVGSPQVVDAGESRPRVAMLLDPDGVPVGLFEGEKTSIAQVVVNCADIDESLRYYQDVMGLNAVSDVADLQWPGELYGRDSDVTVRAALLADGGSVFTVALAQWIDPAPTTEVRVRGANELGLFRMAWSTTDCVADEAVVRAAGSVPFVPTEELSVGDDLPLLLVLFWPGPNGECLELIETTDRSGAL
jgi:catechol 2,3-dioxygenase-like lactoylglutathione lyase family enzyme